MKTLKAIVGYTLAVLAIPVIIVTFMANAQMAELLVKVTGITTSPWNDGGPVAQTIPHDRYFTRIHEPVFQALIGERREGFVQVNWDPPGFLPDMLDEEIDYNGDGIPDFRVQLDTKTITAIITPHTEYVLELQGAYRLDDSLAIRVKLRNERK